MPGAVVISLNLKRMPSGLRFGESVIAAVIFSNSCSPALSEISARTGVECTMFERELIEWIALGLFISWSETSNYLRSC